MGLSFAAGTIVRDPSLKRSDRIQISRRSLSRADVFFSPVVWLFES